MAALPADEATALAVNANSSEEVKIILQSREDINAKEEELSIGAARLSGLINEMLDTYGAVNDQCDKYKLKCINGEMLPLVVKYLKQYYKMITTEKDENNVNFGLSLINSLNYRQLESLKKSAKNLDISSLYQLVESKTKLLVRLLPWNKNTEYRISRTQCQVSNYLRSLIKKIIYQENVANNNNNNNNHNENDDQDDDDDDRNIYRDMNIQPTFTMEQIDNETLRYVVNYLEICDGQTLAELDQLHVTYNLGNNYQYIRQVTGMKIIDNKLKYIEYNSKIMALSKLGELEQISNKLLMTKLISFIGMIKDVRLLGKLERAANYLDINSLANLVYIQACSLCLTASNGETGDNNNNNNNNNSEMKPSLESNLVVNPRNYAIFRNFGERKDTIVLVGNNPISAVSMHMDCSPNNEQTFTITRRAASLSMWLSQFEKDQMIQMTMTNNSTLKLVTTYLNYHNGEIGNKYNDINEWDEWFMSHMGRWKITELVLIATQLQIGSLAQLCQTKQMGGVNLNRMIESGNIMQLVQNVTDKLIEDVSGNRILNVVNDESLDVWINTVISNFSERMNSTPNMNTNQQRRNLENNVNQVEWTLKLGQTQIINQKKYLVIELTIDDINGSNNSMVSSGNLFGALLNNLQRSDSFLQSIFNGLAQQRPYIKRTILINENNMKQLGIKLISKLISKMNKIENDFKVDFRNIIKVLFNDLLSIDNGTWLAHLTHQLKEMNRSQMYNNDDHKEANAHNEETIDVLEEELKQNDKNDKNDKNVKNDRNGNSVATMTRSSVVINKSEEKEDNKDDEKKEAIIATTSNTSSILNGNVNNDESKSDNNNNKQEKVLLWINLHQKDSLLSMDGNVFENVFLELISCDVIAIIAFSLEFSKFKRWMFDSDKKYRLTRMGIEWIESENLMAINILNSQFNIFNSASIRDWIFRVLQNNTSILALLMDSKHISELIQKPKANAENSNEISLIYQQLGYRQLELNENDNRQLKNYQSWMEDTLFRNRQSQQIVYATFENGSRIDNLIPKNATIDPLDSNGTQCIFNICDNYRMKLFGDYDKYFDKQFNLCFCRKCHAARNDKSVYSRGKKKYVLPIGWCRFGLKLNENDKHDKTIFKKWHVSYHGTKYCFVKSILENGLLKKGETTQSGQTIEVVKGHIQHKFERDGYSGQKQIFNPAQLFTSPSIKYASLKAYAVPHIERLDNDNINNNNNDNKDGCDIVCDQLQFVFVCRQKPDTYEIGKDTTNNKTNKTYDKHIPNNAIEWCTTQNQDGVKMTGLLMKVERVSYPSAKYQKQMQKQKRRYQRLLQQQSGRHQ